MSSPSATDRPLPARLIVTALIGGLLGIYFVIGGIWLAALAGSRYYLLAAGGHGGLRTRTGDYVVAHALP